MGDEIEDGLCDAPAGVCFHASRSRMQTILMEGLDLAFGHEVKSRSPSSAESNDAVTA